MTPNDERIDAWLDEMLIHEADPNRPADCGCGSCRILRALDHPVRQHERAAFQREMSMERAWNRRRV